MIIPAIAGFLQIFFLPHAPEQISDLLHFVEEKVTSWEAYTQFQIAVRHFNGSMKKQELFLSVIWRMGLPARYPGCDGRTLFGA